MATLPPNSNPAPVESLSQLHMACMMGEEAVGHVLAMYRRCAGGDDELFASMVNAKTADDSYTAGYTPLHYACQNGFIGAVVLLLEAGADPNIGKNNGATPIVCSVAKAGWRGEMEPYKSCIMLLLDHPRFILKLNDNSDKKCSPVYCCVCQQHASEDVLLPLLEIFLARGFDASATIHNQSSLHMALGRGHEKSAFALVRAGADIYQTVPKSLAPEEGDEDVWTALEACRDMYGNKTARRLELAATASAAVAGPRTRRKILRASAGDTSKMAAKAYKTANTLMAAGRPSEAACAYMEAIEYPADALDKRGRAIAFKNLSTCLSQVSRMEEAERYARQFCQEFPDNPCAFFTLANTIWHQQTLSGVDEVLECIEKADRLLSRARGDEPWFMDMSLEDMRARLRNLKETAKRLQNAGPAEKAAQTATDEYNKDHPDIVKAAHAIDEALNPELKHPNPQSVRALRGSIYFQWGKDIIETPDNSVVSGDGTGLPDLAGVSLQKQPVLLAEEKFETALAEFEYCADLAGDSPDFARTVYHWNSGLALIALNRFDEGCARCLENLRKRLEEQLVNVDMTEGTTKSRPVPVVINSSTNELLYQLENAFHCASMLAKRQAEISSEDDKPYECMSDTAREAFAKLRADGAAAIVESVLSAQSRLSSPSSRVVGMLLKEAHQWDPTVVVPEELNKAQSKVPAPLRCGACGIPNPSNRCPCGNAHYCSKACQVKVWKQHKSDCAFQKERKGKK
jgi:tetratricopeptide (TPR) repeat protein